LLNIDQIRERLADRNLAHVAREIGMKRQQLWLIATSATKNPRADTMLKISNYLEARA
jgi:DNA-binding phage protein